MLVQEKVPTTVKLRSHESWFCFHVWLLMYCSTMPCSTCLCVPLSLECLAFLFDCCTLFSLLRTSSTRIGYCQVATLGVTPLHLFLWMKIANLVFGLGHWMIVSSELLTSLHRHSKCSVFLLHCRYDLASNRWSLESHIPRKPPCNSSFAFTVLDGELYAITFWNTVERLHKRAGRLYIQIYHPQQKTWRTLITKSPFRYDLDFDAAVMSTVHLWTSFLIACTYVNVKR